jgi:PKD repeat protein
LKKILSLAIISLLLISTFSMLASQVKAKESENPFIAPEDFEPQPIEELFSGSDVLIIQDAYTWGMYFSPDAAVCEELGLSYDLVTSATFGTLSLSTLLQYKAIILMADQPGSFYDNLYAYRGKLADYVSNGGVLSAVIYCGWINYLVTQQFLPGGVILNFEYCDDVDFSPTHYLIANPNRPVSLMGPWGYNTIIDNIYYASSFYFTNLPAGAIIVASDVHGHCVIVEYPFGNGKVLAVGIPIQWFYRYKLGLGGTGCEPPWDGANNLRLLYNEIEYQTLAGALNQPPVAKFNFSPSEPKAGEQIIFDPSLSYDPDGKIVSYEWDWDSDGNYEVYTGSPLTIIFWWPEPGEYRVGLKVTDDKGAVSITCKNIVIRQSATGEANAILVGYFDWLHEWWWENHKNFVTIDTWLRDFMPGSETLDWLKGTKFAWCKEADVVYVFNKEIDPSLAPGLTYKIHILNTIYEEELVNEAWRQITPTYEILKGPVRKLISRSIWSLPQKLGEQAILDLAPELGVGISTILLVAKIHGLVDVFNEVKKVTYVLALGTYFRYRLLDEEPDAAWNEASRLANLVVKEEVLPATKWYFEELWLKYKDYGQPYVGLLTSVREDIRAKVKELLLSALEKYKNELPNRKRANIASIAELRVYDVQGRVTGLVNGEVREEIPNSVYNNDTRMVEIFLPADQYTYEVVGKAEEMYGLEIVSIENGESIIFNAVDIPISTNVVHRYIIDWSTLSAGGEGVILQIDSNGDGIFEKSLTSDNELNHDEFVLQTATTIDFDPDTLNLASKGKVVTVYIELPADYSLNQIDISSIKINNTVSALTYPFEINDYDYDGIPELMVKFDRASVIALFSGVNIPGNYVIEVTGKWKDICFKANTTIRVISLPKALRL